MAAECSGPTIGLGANCHEVVTSETVSLLRHQQFHDLFPRLVLWQRNVQTLHEPSTCSFIDLLRPVTVAHLPSQSSLLLFNQIITSS